MSNKPGAANEANTNLIPDPWETEASSKPKRATWQFPLDPQHELAAAAPPDGFLSPQGDPAVPQIPAHVSQATASPAEALLTDELKVDARQNRTLWEHIRDALTLMWWRRDEEESAV